MINVFFWIGIGALSGWIGYLATRPSEKSPVMPYLAIGTVGGLVGGFVFRVFGLSEGSMTIDTGSIFNALLVSAMLVVAYVVFLNFFGKTSSR